MIKKDSIVRSDTPPTFEGEIVEFGDRSSQALPTLSPSANKLIPQLMHRDPVAIEVHSPEIFAGLKMLAGEIIPALTEIAIKHPDPEMRAKASLALGSYGADAESELPILLKALKLGSEGAEQDARVNVSHLITACKIGCNQAATVAATIVADVYPNLRVAPGTREIEVAIEKCLAAMGPHLVAPMRIAIQSLGGTQHTLPLTLIPKMGTAALELIPDLVKRLDSGTNPSENLETVGILADLGAEGDAVLQNYFKHGSNVTARARIISCADIENDPKVRELIVHSILSDADPDVRSAAIVKCRHLNNITPEVHQAWIAALADTSPRVRLEAQAALDKKFDGEGELRVCIATHKSEFERNGVTRWFSVAEQGDLEKLTLKEQARKASDMCFEARCMESLTSSPDTLARTVSELVTGLLKPRTLEGLITQKALEEARQLAETLQLKAGTIIQFTQDPDASEGKQRELPEFKRLIDRCRSIVSSFDKEERDSEDYRNSFSSI